MQKILKSLKEDQASDSKNMFYTKDAQGLINMIHGVKEEKIVPEAKPKERKF